MLEFKKKRYVRNIPKGKYVLAGDIGGTNSNFGIHYGKKPKLILSIHFKSEEIKDFADVVKYVVNHAKNEHNITFSAACFAVAGVQTKKGVSLTNRNFSVEITKIKKKSNIKSVSVINDFQAVSLGINLLPKNKIIKLKDGVKVNRAPKIVIGAGTGLGKGFLIYEESRKSYVGHASEGGHGDAVAIGKEDRKLFNFVQKETRREVVEWEDLISGRGIANLYHFIGHLKKYPKTKYTDLIKKDEAPQMSISKYKHKDPQSRDAYRAFVKFYARCAKNFALDILPFGGIYIAGGIAAANPEPFKHKIFVEEFVNSFKQKDLLKKMPIFLIHDYNVSLYGAAIVALHNKRGKL